MAQKTRKPAKPAASKADAVAEPDSAAAQPKAGIDKRVVAGVAGIAVGSAAIAAALMFTTRYKAKPVVPPPPEPKVPNRPREPDASDIKIGN